MPESRISVKYMRNRIKGQMWKFNATTPDLKGVLKHLLCAGNSISGYSDFGSERNRQSVQKNCAAPRIVQSRTGLGGSPLRIWGGGGSIVRDFEQGG